jgi:hypothetical protein
MVGKTKPGIVKNFFTNPLSYVSLLILILTFVFNWGGSTVTRKNDITGIKEVQTEMKTDIKSIQTSVSLQNQQWTDFSNSYKKGRGKDTTNVIKLINGVKVLNGALEKHLKNSKLDSEYIQFLKDQLRKNDNN